jgi:hypothetical protein
MLTTSQAYVSLKHEGDKVIVLNAPVSFIFNCETSARRPGLFNRQDQSTQPTLSPTTALA